MISRESGRLVVGITWNTDDVYMVFLEEHPGEKPLTQYEAEQVLYWVEGESNATVGISWDVIRYALGCVLGYRGGGEDERTTVE